jgi:hypothetical protein
MISFKIKKMNRKNRILTMLSCLNCVHTTHAVEKTSADTQIIAQDNGQESFDELLEQCKLQNLRLYVGSLTGNPDRDAAIKKEKTMQKLYAQFRHDSIVNIRFFRFIFFILKDIIYLNDLIRKSQHFLKNNQRPQSGMGRTCVSWVGTDGLCASLKNGG